MRVKTSSAKESSTASKVIKKQKIYSVSKVITKVKKPKKSNSRTHSESIPVIENSQNGKVPKIITTVKKSKKSNSPTQSEPIPVVENSQNGKISEVIAKIKKSKKLNSRAQSEPLPVVENSQNGKVPEVITRVKKFKKSNSQMQSKPSPLVEKSQNKKVPKLLTQVKKSRKLNSQMQFKPTSLVENSQNEKIGKKCKQPEKITSGEKDKENKRSRFISAGIKDKISENVDISESVQTNLTQDKNTFENHSNNNTNNKRAQKLREKIDSLNKNKSDLHKTAKKRKLEVTKEEEGDKSNDDLCSKDLSKKHVLSCVKAIYHLTEEYLKEKHVLFDNEQIPVYMQVTCIRIPKMPHRQMRVSLPHSMVSLTDDVALIVCDLEKGKRKDLEPTIDHYQEILNKHNCTCIKNILPLNQIITEFGPYEMKRKLLSAYDYFLVDGRIAGHVSKLLGKCFIQAGRLPTPIKLNKSSLKEEIEGALRKTSVKLGKGDNYVMKVGHTSMKKQHICENIFEMCKVLTNTLPGGWKNIRCIRIKTNLGKAIPIYMTLKNKNSVSVPTLRPKRPRAYRKVEGELSTLPGVEKVTVTPKGVVTLQFTREKKKHHKRDANSKSNEKEDI